MASLIKCIDCGEKISKSAKICPHCGCRTKYGKEQNKKNKENIFILLCVTMLFILIVASFILVKNNDNILEGVWSNSQPFSDDIAGVSNTSGTITTTYTFSKDGNCNEKISKVGTNVFKTIMGEYIESPYTRDSSDNCMFSINMNKSKITIFYSDDYEDDIEEYNNCLEKLECDEEDEPLKSNYEEEYSLSIGDNSIFIDGLEYTKK